MTLKPKEKATTFTNDRAFREGWGLWDVDCGPPHIQRLDDPQSVDESYPAEPIFASDKDAIKYVREIAAAGSAYHQEALELARL